jgi:hypothetical protein
MADHFYNRLVDIAECELCDEKGKRLDAFQLPCDHLDHSAAAKRGMDMIRQTMGWK